MATFKNRKTEETADFDVEIVVGPGVATANGPGASALFEKLKAWGKPGGIADGDFDIHSDGVTLQRCGVAGELGPGGLTIDFMESELSHR